MLVESATARRSVSAGMPSSAKVVGRPISRIKAAKASMPLCAAVGKHYRLAVVFQQPPQMLAHTALAEIDLGFVFVDEIVHIAVPRCFLPNIIGSGPSTVSITLKVVFRSRAYEKFFARLHIRSAGRRKTRGIAPPKPTPTELAYPVIGQKKRRCRRPTAALRVFCFVTFAQSLRCNQTMYPCRYRRYDPHPTAWRVYHRTGGFTSVANPYYYEKRRLTLRFIQRTTS